jgi:hypothetical protein
MRFSMEGQPSTITTAHHSRENRPPPSPSSQPHSELQPHPSQPPYRPLQCTPTIGHIIPPSARRCSTPMSTIPALIQDQRRELPPNSAAHMPNDGGGSDRRARSRATRGHVVKTGKIDALSRLGGKLGGRRNTRRRRRCEMGRGVRHTARPLSWTV